MIDILLTSGYNFEGYRITKYLGFCSGECVLGTGFFSSFEAGVADLLGANSTLYEEKLSKAKLMAISELETNARSLGANAIIGLDVDYTTFTSDIMGVIVNGTAVIVEKIITNEYIQFSKLSCCVIGEQEENNVIHLPIINYYPNLPVRLFNMTYDISAKEIQIFIYSYKGKVSAMNVDIIANTIFGTQYEYTDINFIDCNLDAGVIKTEKVLLNISYNQLKIIQSISVKIKYYILDGETYSLENEYKTSSMSLNSLLEFRKLYGKDVENDFYDDTFHWKCMCGNENEEEVNCCPCCGRTKMIYTKAKNSRVVSLSNLLPELSELKNCGEIYNYLVNIKQEQEFHFPEEIKKEFEGLLKTERIYGNMKEAGIRLLKKYISENE